MAEGFEFLRDLGSGSFGLCKLAKDLSDGELVAVKFIPRGSRIDRNVEREVLVHSQMNHPNVVGFKKVFVTKDHLCLALEYATGGELFNRVKNAGRFDEDMARFFFQQLIAGVAYCHQQGVFHRDLKLENTLIKLEETVRGRAPTPVLKIADFGFAKRDNADTPPDSRVGTPAYISPEVLKAPHPYDGKAADVWSCAVHLYIMLVGWYPFTDPREPHNFSKTADNIQRGKYAFPANLAISKPCKDLIRRMLVKEPSHRITIPEIYEDPWFRVNLSHELMGECQGLPKYPPCPQSQDDVKEVLKVARVPGQA